MSETTPVMKPRTLKDGSVWYIELTWPDGRVDNLRSAGVAAGRVWGNSSSCERQNGPLLAGRHGFGQAWRGPAI